MSGAGCQRGRCQECPRWSGSRVGGCRRCRRCGCRWCGCRWCRCRWCRCRRGRVGQRCRRRLRRRRRRRVHHRSRHHGVRGDEARRRIMSDQRKRAGDQRGNDGHDPDQRCAEARTTEAIGMRVRCSPADAIDLVHAHAPLPSREPECVWLCRVSPSLFPRRCPALRRRQPLIDLRGSALP